MTITLTKPGGWGVNQKLKSSEATALDANTVKALDRTAAGDTLLGVVTLASGAGLTLASGSALTMQSGSVVTVGGVVTLASGAGLTLASGSALTMQSGSVVTVGGTDRIALSPRTRRIAFNSVPALTMAGTGTYWEIRELGLWYREVAVSISTKSAWWPLPTREGMSDISVSITVNGNFGHVGLPQYLPEIYTERSPIATDNYAVVATGTDASATLAAYLVPHQITCSVASIDPSVYKYRVSIRGEAGTNAIVNGVFVDHAPHGTASYSYICEEA